MKVFAVITALATFAGVAVAAPAQVEQRQVPYDPCSGLYDTVQCCATDVLGVADLDCANPPAVAESAADLQAICSDIGQRARCCVLPVLGQALLCQTPAGIQP